MIKIIKQFMIAAIVLIGTVQSINASDRIYIDSKELNIHKDVFRMHVGDNVWLETNAIHRDDTGLYTFENDINTIMNNKTQQSEYVKKWKCPYCYQYWPIGTACQNKDCPSKYK